MHPPFDNRLGTYFIDHPRGAVAFDVDTDEGRLGLIAWCNAFALPEAAAPLVATETPLGRVSTDLAACRAFILAAGHDLTVVRLRDGVYPGSTYTLLASGGITFPEAIR